MAHENLKNKWLYYPWLPSQGLNHYIHPDDIDKLNGQGIGLVICIEDEDDEYVKVKNNSFIGRVRRSGVKHIFPSPTYIWGQEVKIKSKPPLNCLITDFFWHHKDSKYYYQLMVGDKINKKRYSEDDLEPTE